MKGVYVLPCAKITLLFITDILQIQTFQWEKSKALHAN